MRPNIANVKTDSLPVPVLKIANAVRNLAWQALGANLRGAGILARDADTGEVLIVNQSYGPKEMWCMPGGGVVDIPNGSNQLDIVKYSAVKEFTEETKIPEVDIQNLRHLTTSTASKGRVTDDYSVYSATINGLNDYVESFRGRPEAQKLSREMSRLWMVPPEWLPNSDLNLHHALRAGAIALSVERI